MNPHHIKAHSNLGIALSQDPKQLPEAIFHLQRAYQLNPQDLDNCMNLALAYSAQSRYPEAVAAAREALRIARHAGQTERIRVLENWLATWNARSSPPPSIVPKKP